MIHLLPYEDALAIVWGWVGDQLGVMAAVWTGGPGERIAPTPT
jgi:hypothetical protein